MEYNKNVIVERGGKQEKGWGHLKITVIPLRAQPRPGSGWPTLDIILYTSF
jgi:hypothetical protein